MTRKIKLYAITHDILGDVFWEVFRKGLIDAASRYNLDVEHLRPGKFSPEIQASLIEAATAAKPDGIISTIPEVAAVDSPLRSAIDQGIPVICINAKDDRPDGERIPYLFYIGGNDKEAGELAAHYLSKSLILKSALCVDHYLHDHICHNDRWIGFRTILEQRNTDAQRLRIPGEDLSTSARKIVAFVKEHPEVNAILTLGPPGAEAVLQAAELVGHPEFPRHLTFDIAPLQLEAIRTGKILATIDSQQYLQGYLSVEWMWLYLNCGFTLSKDIYTGPVIVDPSNVESAADGVARGFR
ncbi:MAG: sugar ABC transporter substrate-binding protein [Verrucomicrobia bacterium]|nr:sugar ABC transporter substrate-binding protein [Verrucomicrobiota bacterium]